MLHKPRYYLINSASINNLIIQPENYSLTNFIAPSIRYPAINMNKLICKQWHLWHLTCWSRVPATLLAMMLDSEGCWVSTDMGRCCANSAWSDQLFSSVLWHICGGGFSSHFFFRSEGWYVEDDCGLKGIRVWNCWFCGEGVDWALPWSESSKSNSGTPDEQ